MCKDAETFNTKVICRFSTNFAVFKTEICGILARENQAVRIPTFYMKINHFNIVFRMT